jgi:hypothetical protein
MKTMSTYKIIRSIGHLNVVRWAVAIEGVSEGKDLSDTTYSTKREAEAKKADLEQRELRCRRDGAGSPAR